MTPDGVYRTAKKCQNQELFFAFRGGGGSAFGVVIESIHRTEPRFPVQAYVPFLYSWSRQLTPLARLRFPQVHAHWDRSLADWYSSLVNTWLQWANDVWGGHIVVSDFPALSLKSLTYGRSFVRVAAVYHPRGTAFEQ